MMRKEWNRQGENSNRITAAEIIQGNNASIPAETYNFTYHAKQLGTGLLVFGAGLLGYVGFSAFFGNRRETKTLKADSTIDTINLAFEKTSIGIPTETSKEFSSLDYHVPENFIPTASSTSRTLLSLQENVDQKSDVKTHYRSVNSAKPDNIAQISKSTRRSITEIGYPGGAEFRVNTYTTFDQSYPAVAAFPTGGFVVVWASDYQDGSNDGIYGQRYNATGLPVGSEFRVHTYAILWQSYPAVTAFISGSFVNTAFTTCINEFDKLYLGRFYIIFLHKRAECILFEKRL